MIWPKPSPRTDERIHSDGSTHPSFSDIHLILPTTVNRRIGLTTDPVRILDLTVRGTVEFLRRDTSGMERRAKNPKYSEWVACKIDETLSLAPVVGSPTLDTMRSPDTPAFLGDRDFTFSSVRTTTLRSTTSPG